MGKTGEASGETETVRVKDEWKIDIRSMCDEDSFLSFVSYIQDLLPYIEWAH